LAPSPELITKPNPLTWASSLRIGHLDGDDENLPAAIFRGLNWGFMLTNRATDAGVYAFLAIDAPSKSRVSVGFRCARQP